MTKWERIRYFPCKPLGEDGRLATGCAAHVALARHICHEGIVLLKNDGGVLPLQAEEPVVLLGKASADYVAGGGGAGSVESAYTSTLIDGMRENGVKLFEPLAAFYEEQIQAQYRNGVWPGHTAEPEIPAALLVQAEAFASTAVVSLCRKTWEAFDVKPTDEPNSYYLTAEEKALLEIATAHFRRVIVVLNIGSLIDPTPFARTPGIQGIVLGYQGGMEGGYATADVLCGRVNPCGKLTDTYAPLEAYPTTAGYGESLEYVHYTEGVFVGYRYFDTIPGVAGSVCFPFGFGLSYTTFSMTLCRSLVVNDIVRLRVAVSNAGAVAGREVVQVYAVAPGRVSRPQKELRAFAKTPLLAPGETAELTLEFAVNDLAYYDEERAAYVLEAGAYRILYGNSSMSLALGLTYEQATETVVRQLRHRCVPVRLPRVLQSDGTYRELPVTDETPPPSYADYPPVTSLFRAAPYDHILPDGRGMPVAEGGIRLQDVADGKHTLEELLAQLTNDELITLVGGCPNAGVANTAGIGGLESHEIPAAMTADGPAGLRLRPELAEKTTAFPCAALLASSFNTELAEAFGRAVALEVKENHFGIWLAPALNIHRSPLNGRNFEYFSEDPLVSGKMAAALVRGAQSRGIAACVKHFACNNKESGRDISDSRVSERALREIYLRGFEIAVTEAHPLMVMTSYNRLNGQYTSADRDLLTGILREEWQYDGLVATDWDNRAEPITELQSGNDLRMPAGSNRRLQRALADGAISRGSLMSAARHVLELLLHLE